MHTDFPSTGRFCILVLTSTDLLDPQGKSAQTFATLTTEVIPRFPPSLIEHIVIHPRLPGDFTWKDLPKGLKEYSEMRFYSGYELDDVYAIYGVDDSEGAVAVIRPDGYVGVVAGLDELQRVEAYLGQCLRSVEQ